MRSTRLAPAALLLFGVAIRLPAPASAAAALVWATILVVSGSAPATSGAPAGVLVSPDAMVQLLFAETMERAATLEKVRQSWHPGYAVMLVEVLYFRRDPEARRDLIGILEAGTGQSLGSDIKAWYEWLWSRPPGDHPRYADFKRQLYRQIDERFDGYFDPARAIDIRLDEVRWGGVRQDGIPPLRSPKMVAAREASYLDDDNIIFGLEVNGDARAYPKRILAWHEMFTDTVGGIPVAGVYCTLCGTVILYETKLGDTDYRMGTSGFLYRSNKLMYDQATQSLWNTIWGRPVIGPLVGKDIELPRRSVVTTKWGEWRRRHPESQVLSLATGHQRDYSEGAAYREYFATDRLMFNVPKLDKRLANKAEVLTFVGDGEPPATLAIAARFLAKKSVFHERVGEERFVVLTDRSGANRAYRTAGLRFSKWDRDQKAIDENGASWRVTERALVAEDGRELARLPATRAFWFGWYAAYPGTRLVRSR